MDAELNAWVWLLRVFLALAVAALAAVAIWTVVRTPGRGQDPGLHPEEDGPGHGGGPGEGGGRNGVDEPWKGGG